MRSLSQLGDLVDGLDVDLEGDLDGVVGGDFEGNSNGDRLKLDSLLSYFYSSTRPAAQSLKVLSSQ